MPAAIWYVDQNATPGAWIGPYGPGIRVNTWASVTKAADSWYFGMGGQTVAAPSFWNVDVNALLFSSYGEGRHVMDFTSAAMQGSGIKTPFRVRNPSFAMRNFHIKGATAQDHLIYVSDNGQAGLKIRDSKLQGPGYRSSKSGAYASLAMSASTNGDFLVANNDMWGCNCGFTYGGAIPLSQGLVVSNTIRDLSWEDPGNSDGMTFGGSGAGGLVSPLLRLRILNNDISGFSDHGLDTVGCYGAWIEGNFVHNDDRDTGDSLTCGGLVLGGAGSAGPVAGGNFVLRNRIELVRRIGYGAGNTVIGINTRYGSDNLIIGNVVRAPNTALRNEDGAGSPNFVVGGGLNNQAFNNTLHTTESASTDTPVWNVSGSGFLVQNNALIRTGAGAAIRGSGTSATTATTNATNAASLVLGSGVTASGNILNASMPSGPSPDYFPTAALLGVGTALARKYADLYGAQWPDLLIGALAPDQRTTALPGVTRKWFKGWARPGAVLA
jgi:hypothetical protein